MYCSKVKLRAIVHPTKGVPALKIVKLPQLPCLSHQSAAFRFDCVWSRWRGQQRPHCRLLRLLNTVWMEALCSSTDCWSLQAPRGLCQLPRGALHSAGGMRERFWVGEGHRLGVGCVAGASRGRAPAQRYLLVLRGDVILELHKRRKSRGFYAQPDDISSIQ